MPLPCSGGNIERDHHFPCRSCKLSTSKHCEFHLKGVDGSETHHYQLAYPVRSRHHVFTPAGYTVLDNGDDVQMLFLVGGAQMIVAEVVVAALLGHYFTAGANWVVPNDVGLAILIIICIFVSGFAYRSHAPSHGCALPGHPSNMACKLSAEQTPVMALRDSNRPHHTATWHTDLHDTCSWGPLGWLYPSEVLSLETRSAGYGVV